MLSESKHSTGMGYIGGSKGYPVYTEFEPAFIGMEEKDAKSLESKIKKDYELTDFQDSSNPQIPGYLIKKRGDETTYVFSPNARLTLETRYLEKDENKQVMENILDLLTRVAVNIASADLKYDSKANVELTAIEFLEVMLNREFLPNTPTLCNAGRALQQLSACFVLPVEDYVGTDDIGEDPEKQGNGIFDTARYMAMIHKSGGGTGFNFSRLRPKSDGICTTYGSSSGPVSFLKAPFDASTDAINQGGFRRGANMGILEYWHPDIFEFIHEKQNWYIDNDGKKHNSLENFNLSVGVDSNLMKSVKADGYFRLISPRDQASIPLEERIYQSHKLFRERKFPEELTEKQQREKTEYMRLLKEMSPSLLLSEDGKGIINVYNRNVVGKVGKNHEILISSRALFDYIVECAYKEGCPGLIFLDKMNEDNPTPQISRIESTNPCGEQPLLPYESCNLGSINLAGCVENGSLNPSKIERLVRTGVHFLDNVIDKSKYPTKKIYMATKGNRKIGLGVMGFADMLTLLNLPYESIEALDLGRKVMRLVDETAKDESEKLGNVRGVFPHWKGSVYDPNSEFCKEDKKGKMYRNAAVTTIAPTGTISMIADVSSGIEPLFALAYTKTCMDNRELHYTNNVLTNLLANGGLKPSANIEEMLKKIEEKGSIQSLEEVSPELKLLFKTAHEITPEMHIEMQKAFQEYVDNAVSKTINLPKSATKEDIAKIYMLSYEIGCKGITVFRDGCKDKQVLSKGKNLVELVRKDVERPSIVIEADDSGKYKVKRHQNKDSLHLVIADELYVDRKNKKAYLLPKEIFQNRAPLGEETSVDFQQEGMDRTEILKAPDVDYAEIIKRWKSASSDDEEGIGPGKIKSKHHAVGVMFEYHLLQRGIVGYDKETNTLINLVMKPNLELVTDPEEKKEILSANGMSVLDKEKRLQVNTADSLADFKCPECDNTEYYFEAGCHSPKCRKCGWSDGCG